MKLLFATLFLSSFSILTYAQGYEPEKEWIKTYKELVFLDGLFLGLNNKDVVKKITQIDNSFYNPVFRLLHQKAIDRGSKYLIERIKQDAIARAEKVAVSAAGRRSFQVALDFYDSGKLDEIAKLEYLRWTKLPNQKQLVEKARQIY